MAFDWNGRTVLVTGAGGFIGSHLTERLVARGARVRAFVKYNGAGLAGWLDTSPVRNEIEIVAGDVSDPDQLRECTRGVDTVFHLAALIAIPYSYRSPAAYVRVNVGGTLNALTAAREADVRRFVHTSTSETYGTAQYVPIDEKHPLVGQSPYSASKIGADKIAESFHLSFGLPVATLRPFNTYGPRQSARAVIPTIITQLLAGAEELKLGALEPTRDFNFAHDTADAFIATAESDAAVGRTINAGSGREISIGALAELLFELTGRRAAIRTEDRRLRPANSEVERLLADNTRAKELLAWGPKVPLRDGLAQTIEWMRANLGRYRPGEYAV